MLIALFIWILVGVWVIVCIPGVIEVIKSTIEGWSFWFSVLYLMLIIIIAPIWLIAGFVKGIIRLFKH